jgi:hypothetical protein
VAEIGLQKTKTIVSDAAQFGWGPMSYEDYLKSPAGQAELTNAKLAAMEELMAKFRLEKEAQAYYASLYAVEESVEKADKNQDMTSSSVTNREKLLSGEAQRLKDGADSMDRIMNQFGQSSVYVGEKRKEYSSETSELDTNTKKRVKIAGDNLQGAFKGKSAFDSGYTPYDITSGEYNDATEHFREASKDQSKKLGVLAKKEGLASICEREAQVLSQNVESLRQQLNMLPLDPSPTSEVSKLRSRVTKQIIKAEEMIREKQATALSIRSEVARERAEVNNALADISRNEAAWDMAAAQTGIGVPAAEHQERVAARSQMLASVRRRSVLGPITEREAENMTDAAAMKVLGIDKAQWDALPNEIAESARDIENKGSQDKMDLLQEALIKQSQKYTDKSTPGNIDRQNLIQKAYLKLDETLSNAPEQTVSAAQLAEAENASAEKMREARLNRFDQAQPVDQASAFAADSVPYQAPSRLMNAEERAAVAATIDKNPQAQQAFYDGGATQQRNVVQQGYQQAIRDQAQAQANLDNAVANPSKSSALANQQDQEYYSSLVQEAEQRVNNYGTLANYYDTEPVAQSEPTVVSDEASNLSKDAQRDLYATAAEQRLNQGNDLSASDMEGMPDQQHAPVVVPGAASKLSQDEQRALYAQSAEQRRAQSGKVLASDAGTTPTPPQPASVAARAAESKLLKKERLARAEAAEQRQQVQNNNIVENNLANAPTPRPTPAAAARARELELAQAPRQLTADELRVREARLKRFGQQPALSPVAMANASVSVIAMEEWAAKTPSELQQNFSKLLPPGHECVVTPHSDGHGYSVNLGENNVLNVNENPQNGLMRADLSYDKNSLSPAIVAQLLTETAPTDCKSVVRANVAEAEGVQEELITELMDGNVIADERNVIAEAPELPENTPTESVTETVADQTESTQLSSESQEAPEESSSTLSPPSSSSHGG